MPPNTHYKKAYILPDGFIPGPNKPKYPDSFLLPTLYHIACLQHEGLPIWDAVTNLHCSVVNVPVVGTSVQLRG